MPKFDAPGLGWRVHLNNPGQGIKDPVCENNAQCIKMVFCCKQNADIRMQTGVRPVK